MEFQNGFSLPARRRSRASKSAPRQQVAQCPQVDSLPIEIGSQTLLSSPRQRTRDQYIVSLTPCQSKGRRTHCRSYRPYFPSGFESCPRSQRHFNVPRRARRRHDLCSRSPTRPATSCVSPLVTAADAVHLAVEAACMFVRRSLESTLYPSGPP